jgi:hypothetical protein
MYNNNLVSSTNFLLEINGAEQPVASEIKRIKARILPAFYGDQSFLLSSH